MKKNILLIFCALLLLACSARKKNANQRVGLRAYTAYYNTLFNSKDALETELKNRDKAHKDNFHAPYIHILTTEDEPLGADISKSGAFFDVGALPGNAKPNKSTSILAISEAKALKAIANYSVMKNGVEKNKRMFEASILLAQARLYQNKPLEALDALNYIFYNMPRDKRLNLAKIYQAEAYAKLGDYYRANELFLALGDLKKDYQKLKTIYYSEMLVQAGRKEDAVKELENAFAANKNRKLRSRISFLRGQVLAALGQKNEARESFTTAYKYANDFEFEVKSQVEIAKTFNSKTDDYEGAKNYLENISRKGTYATRKNELYYALGLLAKDAGKKEEAGEYFRKALAQKASDPQVRGLTYYEIGQSYLADNDYLAAGAYYDSAVAVMDYEPAKLQLTALNRNIKKITQNYYLIKKNDSILALTRMTQPEREAYFSKYIENLKAKEAEKLAIQKKNERNQSADTGDYNPNSIFATSGNGAFQDFDSNSKGFYFANQNAMSKGQATFRQVWGSRSLQDNWRYSARTVTIEDVKNQTLGITAVQDPRRFETIFYTEKIPTDPDVLSSLKKDRDTASLGIGRMYEDYFGNTALATKTLYDLVDSKPESDVKLQALYQIFAINYQKNPSAAERAKNMILSDYPNTSYAEFVKNPKSTAFTRSATEVEEAYTKAYTLYSEGKYEESQKVISASLEKYPQDALVPKFTLLSAYNTGKTTGKNDMYRQLEALSLNYAKTPEGLKARDLLGQIKIDTPNTPQKAAEMVQQQNMQQIPPQQAVQAQGSVSSTYIQQAGVQPVPQINTTQNVVQPGSNQTMPTSPSANAADINATVPVSTGPPGQVSNETGVGVPLMTPTEKKKANETR